MDLRFSSPDEGVREVRQTDLRSVEVRAVVEDLVAGVMVRVDPQTGEVDAATYGSQVYHKARRTLERARSGKGHRTITPQLLARVAEIYRANLDGRPTQAVRDVFMVSDRMASEYVQQARRRGLLPPTTPGKKRG